MAKALVEIETIDVGQIDDLMARKPMRVPASVVDSDEASSELGTGEIVPDTKPTKDEPLTGETPEQFA
jgi:cell division protease FtsH